MVFWYVLVVCSAIMVVGLVLWNILLYTKQRDMQFELDKITLWKKRVEAATTTLNTNLLEHLDTSFREHWKYEKLFSEIIRSIERWAERFANLRGDKE
jgi:hypothetical protein